MNYANICYVYVYVWQYVCTCENGPSQNCIIHWNWRIYIIFKAAKWLWLKMKMDGAHTVTVTHTHAHRTLTWHIHHKKMSRRQASKRRQCMQAERACIQSQGSLPEGSRVHFICYTVDV